MPLLCFCAIWTRLCCMGLLHLRSFAYFLLMQPTWNFYLFQVNKSSEYSTASLWSTVVSFFLLSVTESKAGTHRVEMDSLGPKQRMWNFGATQEGIFSLRVSGQETKHNTDCNIAFIEYFVLRECSLSSVQEKTSHIVLLCKHSCATTHRMANATPNNKNSCKREQEWEQAEQTCPRIEICFELSHDQALTHSWLVLRFLSTEETTAKSSGAFSMWNYFSTAAHIGSAWGTSLQLSSLFWFFTEHISIMRSRENVQAKQRNSVATGRHVETIPSTSSICGSRDSLQQHIIIRIPDFIMESFFPPSLTFSSWLSNPLSNHNLFSLSSDLGPILYYFQHVWGLMGAEKGNYTASDLCMIVGFGLWLRVGSRMAETSHRELVLVCGHNRPPNGDLSCQSGTEQWPLATLCTCPTLVNSQCQQVLQDLLRTYVHFCEVKLPQTLWQVGWTGGGFFIVCTHLLDDSALKGDYITTIVASKPSAFLHWLV